MKKKLMSLLLAAVMVLSLLPHTAWAATYTGSVPANVNYSYNTGTKTLTLSGSGPLNNSSDYSYFHSWADFSTADVEKVVIKSGITELGNYAFARFYNMTSITIPDTVTRIGDSAFDYCRSLTSIKLPKNLKTIGSCAFYYCYDLTSITIPSKVTEVGSAAFVGCRSLTSVTFQGSITEIGEEAFHGCSSLTSVTFPQKVGSGAVIDEQAFAETPLSASLVIPEGVESINYFAFDRCKNLRSVTFPTTLKYMYSGAFGTTALESATFKGDAPSIIRGTFYVPTIYYPAGNPTWTEGVRQNISSKATWVAVCMGDHTLGEWTTVDETKHQRSCAYCDYKETADHTWDAGTTTLAPTCTATGEALHTCTACGATKTEILPMADHPYSPWEKVDDQTHTHTCTVCSKVETLDHSWDEGTVIKAANCIADGETKYTCTGCGLTRNEVVPMNGIHTYDHGCDNDCNVCGATRTTQHKYSTDWSSSKSGHWHKCVNCGDKQAAAAHVPGPEATEETPQTCTVCGYILKPTLKHEHDFAAALTGDETGHWYACASCSEQKDFTAHDFVNDCDTTCDDCGFERLTEHVWSEEWTGDENGHFHACTVCGEKQTESMSGHDFRRGVCKVCAAEDPGYEPMSPVLIALIAAAGCAAVAAPVIVLGKKKKKNAA